MRTMAAVLALLLLFAIGAASAEQRSAKPCPPGGDATRPGIQRLNESKSRVDEPSDEDIDDTVTMDAIVSPGDDRLRWEDGQACEITAYVIEVRDGGMASSNCHSPDPAIHDTILELIPDPNVLDRAHRVVAVITPQWRKTMATDRVDWSTRAIRAKYTHQWVTISGWLLFNFEAASKAINTTPLPGVDIARATAWEIHPVTSIELEEDVLDEEAVLTPLDPDLSRGGRAAAYARSKARISAP